MNNGDNDDKESKKMEEKRQLTEREQRREGLDKKVADSLKIPRFNADTAKNEAINNFCQNNVIAKEILDHHSVIPFRKIQLHCAESTEIRNAYLDILRSIEFSKMLGDVVRELIKIGEAIFVFEGKWSPPKFLNPDSIVVAMITDGYGHEEEHVEYKVDPEIRDMVLNTPQDERKNLLKLLDNYSLRQIELGSHIDLTRSPYVKIFHPRRMTVGNPSAPRGVSYFEPLLDRINEAEAIKKQIIEGKTQDYQSAINKIRETDRLVFNYAFPSNPKFLESELKYLQNIIKYMLTEHFFKPTAMASNFINDHGLVLPILQFEELNLETDQQYLNHVKKLRNDLGIDIETVSVAEYINRIKDEKRNQ